MPPQSHAAQGFAGDAVEIDLFHKGIKTMRHVVPHGQARSNRGNRPDS